MVYYIKFTYRLVSMSWTMQQTLRYIKQGRIPVDELERVLAGIKCSEIFLSYVQENLPSIATKRFYKRASFLTKELREEVLSCCTN